MTFEIILLGLAGVIEAGAPIVIAVIGETLTERSGVINLSLNSPDNLRWRNAAQWARNSMVNDSLLKKDSPRGVWEITPKGTSHLE